ncbi:MAG: PKD domain-containing protein [Euryarchaeota archaeon]|nr:PKD domain-containing protein [Euryarchaeota archaeon]MDE2045260.1 PKD domain-containing protein [Thermoplasmata archaeon]
MNTRLAWPLSAKTLSPILLGLLLFVLVVGGLPLLGAAASASSSLPSHRAGLPSGSSSVLSSALTAPMPGRAPTFSSGPTPASPTFSPSTPLYHPEALPPSARPSPAVAATASATQGGSLTYGPSTSSYAPSGDARSGASTARGSLQVPGLPAASSTSGPVAEPGAVLGSFGLNGYSAGAVFDPITGNFYDCEGTGLYAYNGTTGAMVGSTTLPSGCSAPAWDPAQDLIFAPLGSTLDTVNPVTNTIAGSVSASGHGAAYDPANGMVYLTDTGAASVGVVNAATLAVGTSISVSALTYRAAYDSHNGMLYVALIGTRVAEINPSTSAVSYINVGNTPDGLAVDPTNGQVLVPNYYSSNVSIISGTSIAATWAGFHDPGAPVYDPADQQWFVCQAGGFASDPWVNAVSASSDAIAAVNLTAAGDCSSMVYNSANGDVFDIVSSSNVVTIISTELAVGGIGLAQPTFPQSSVGVGSYPDYSAYDSQNGYLYVTNNQGNSITIIDTSTNSVVTTIGGLNQPIGITYDPANGKIYAIDPCVGATSGALVIISGTTLSSINSGWNCYYYIDYDPANGWLNLVGQAGPYGNFQWIDPNSLVVQAGFQQGSASIAGVVYNPSNRDMYYTDPGYNMLWLADSSGAYTGYASTGNDPGYPDYDPIDHEVYVPNTLGNSVSIYSGSSNVGTVGGVGNEPTSCAFDGYTGDVACVSYDTTTVAFITSSTHRLYLNVAVGGGSGGGLALGATYVPSNHELYITSPINNQVRTLTFGVGGPLTSVDVGQTFALTGSVVAAGSGGDSPSSGASPSGGFACGTHPFGPTVPGPLELICRPGNSGSVSVWINDTDSSSSQVWSQAALTVNQPPIASTPVASPAGSPTNSADVGQTVQFSTGGSFGTGTYVSYSWGGLPGGCSSASLSTVTCTLSSAGALSLTARVTDSNGVTSVSSAALSFTVYADPALTTPTSTVNTTSATLADVGEAATFATTVASSGSGGLSAEAWSGLPGGCSGTGLSISCSALTAAGTFTVSASTTDTNGVRATSAPLTFVVGADPSMAAPAASTSSADVGQTSTFQLVPVGGAAPYSSFTWTGLPATGCAGTTTAAATCTFAASGTLSVSGSATDATGWTVHTLAALAFTAYADPALTTPTLTVNGTASGVADLGQALSFATTLSSSGSGGISSYAWSGLPSGCTGTGAAVACTASVAGTYTVSVSVTDTNGVTAVSPAFSLTINSDPSVPAATTSAITGSGDVGQTVSFTAAPSGGTSPYATFLWTGLPTSCTATATASPSCTFVAADVGTLTISVAVTDSQGWTTGSTSALSFTVYADPALATPSSTVNGTASAVLDAGQALVVATSVSAPGSGGIIAFAWSGLPATCSGAGASISCAPTAVGVYSLVVSGTDSNGEMATSAPFVLTLDPDVSVAMPGAAPTSGDVGQFVVFSAVASGGTGPYASYVWSGLPSVCSGVATATPHCTLATADVGTLTLSVQVTDAQGWTAGSVAPSAFTVYADPVLATPTLQVNGTANSAADVGQSLAFATSVSAPGSGGITTYAWTGLPAGCTGTTATISCVAPASGLHSVSVRATDSNGVSAVSAAFTFAILEDPVVSSVAANASVVDAGASVMFQAAAAGGVPAYASFVWSGLPSSGCTGTSGPVATCVLATVGTLSVSASVVDANGWTSGTSAAVSVSVVADPALAPLAASPSSVEAGQRLNITTSVVAVGTGSDVVSWSVSALGLGCAESASTVLACAPSTSGNYTVTATLRDASGRSDVASIVVSILLAPSVSAPSWPAASEVGIALQASATATGGRGPYTYSWHGLPSGVVATAGSVAGAPTASGSFPVYVTVSDALGGSARSAVTTLVVVPALTASVDLATSAPISGSAVSLVASYQGGSGTVRYAWNFGDGTHATGASPSHVYGKAGTFTAWVWANDSLGASSAASVQVVVKAPAPTVLGAPSNVGYGLLGAIALLAVLAALLALLYLRQRKKRPAPASDVGSAKASDEAAPASEPSAAQDSSSESGGASAASADAGAGTAAPPEPSGEQPWSEESETPKPDAEEPSFGEGPSPDGAGDGPSQPDA